MIEKVPRWESELWSYMSRGDGMRCPVYSQCEHRLGGEWCFDDNAERFRQLLDDKWFSYSKCAFIGSRTGGRVFRRVEMLASEYLKRGRVHYPPVPIELVWLADEQHPIETKLLPLRACRGAVWRLADRWIIHLKSSDPPARNRFTLFHEAFHILAHSRANPSFKRRGTQQGSYNELLADYFATCVLMPREWVKEEWEEIKDLGKMARIFGVPKSVMCFRLKFLGLI